jgi:hypothetical protein
MRAGNSGKPNMTCKSFPNQPTANKTAGDSDQNLNPD